MRVFNITDISKPIESLNSYRGELGLSSVYLWPKWYKPQTKHLFSFERSGRNDIINHVPIEDGKEYTFQDIVNLLKLHLDSCYRFLTYNNGKFSMMLEKDKGIKRVSFCPELIHKFKLPILNNYVTGEVIQGMETDGA